MDITAKSVTCFNVAGYFLSMVDEELGDLVSNLKLQKLVYYAQGFHLAVFKKPLFDEQIEAWTHGPVVPTLYHVLKKYDSGPIPRATDFDLIIFPEDVRKLLDDVYNAYGQYDAWRLRNLTHDEPPWCDAYKRGPGSIISNAAMQDYFVTQLQ